jgi:peptidylprolyl isomerase domain and WD repeat-containing protein 1
VLELDYTPVCVCWVHPRGASIPTLAVSDESSSKIRIYDGRGDNSEPAHTVSLHRRTVILMAYNNTYDCVISADDGGMIEYWQPGGSFEKPDSVFSMKSTTNLFDFKKTKSVPASITISPDDRHFATFSFPDRQVRIFDFVTGKLHRTYDESLTTLDSMQQAGTGLYQLEEVEFGRRMATEKELDHPAVRRRINIIFDESSNFILYGSLLGTKVVNILTNRVVKIYGKEEPFRPLNLSLYQGQPAKKELVTVEMAASDNPLLQEAESRDAMLVSTGFSKIRFYMFTNDEQSV